MFRHEWRQQLLVVSLISLAVAAAVFGATAAYNLTPSRTAEFGAATHRIELGVSDPDGLPAYLDAAREWFGEIDVIRYQQVVVPGSTDRVEVRSQALDGPLTAPMVAVTSGRAPTQPGEVALTDGALARFGADVGDQIDLGRTQATIVGVAENPSDLDDEFALVAPTAMPVPDAISVFVQADHEQVQSFRPGVEPGAGGVAERGQTERTTAAVAVFAVAAVAMVLVCLVAGASFVTLAHRRLRQLGMFAAVGATQHHLRLSMVSNGLAVGVVAAVIGTTTGVVAWILAASTFESAAAHRIDWKNVPLWLLLTGALLAVMTAVVAAWWPARGVARIPITDAISARPPRPRAARRSVAVAVALFVGGIIAINLGIDARADGDIIPILFLPGVVAVVASVLVVSAPVLRGIARLSGHLSVGPRLAMRDLARFETRSAAALGAITLGLGIAVAVVVISSANVPGADEGNLADDQLVVWTSAPGDGGLRVPEPVSDDPVRDRAVDDILRLAGDANVVPLEVAIDPTNPDITGGRRLFNAAILGRPIDENTLRDSGLVFVATPEVLDYLDVDPTAIDTDTIVLTRQMGDVYITGDITDTQFRRDPVPASAVTTIDVHDYSSAPRTLITDAGLDAANLEPMRVGWLLDLPHPLDDSVLSEARAIADESGIAIESRDDDGGQSTVRTVATAAGVVVALSILAMTVGLLRSDGIHDLRTLAATGATGRTRRSLTATTSAVLAALGAVLGLGATYAALLAGYWPEIDRLGEVPVANLAVIIVGLPILAGAVAWILGGRDVSDLARPSD